MGWGRGAALRLCVTALPFCVDWMRCHEQQQQQTGLELNWFLEIGVTRGRRGRSSLAYWWLRRIIRMTTGGPRPQRPPAVRAPIPGGSHRGRRAHPQRHLVRPSPSTLACNNHGPMALIRAASPSPHHDSCEYSNINGANRKEKKGTEKREKNVVFFRKNWGTFSHDSPLTSSSSSSSSSSCSSSFCCCCQLWRHRLLLLWLLQFLHFFSLSFLPAFRQKGLGNAASTFPPFFPHFLEPLERYFISFPPPPPPPPSPSTHPTPWPV